MNVLVLLMRYPSVRLYWVPNPSLGPGEIAKARFPHSHSPDDDSFTVGHFYRANDADISIEY